MTREDIQKHFPDATDDQISALLDINSKDIGKHKTAAETASADLKKANETIQELEKNAKDATALQKTIDDYKAADEKRQADAKAAAERAERMGRFDKAHEEGVFERVITTNLCYRPPELMTKPYYLEADMSKFLASIIDFMNHDLSMENVSTPTEKIQKILSMYNDGE